MNKQKESLLTSMPKLILIVIIIISLGTVLGIIEYLNLKYPSNKISSIFIICPNTVKDIDNNAYETIKIGNQCWMKENLKVTKNPQGKTIARYCYDDDSNICNIDGGLYNWNTAMNGSTEEGAQGICPDGWHIPRASEWRTLEKGLPTKTISVRVFTDCVDIKGSWNYCTPEEENQTKSVEVVDYSNFNLLLAGFRLNSTYFGRGSDDFLWSSTKSRRIRIGHGDSSLVTFSKDHSSSVRCLKD